MSKFLDWLLKRLSTSVLVATLKSTNVESGSRRLRLAPSRFLASHAILNRDANIAGAVPVWLRSSPSAVLSWKAVWKDQPTRLRESETAPIRPLTFPQFLSSLVMTFAASECS